MVRAAFFMWTAMGTLWVMTMACGCQRGWEVPVEPPAGCRAEADLNDGTVTLDENGWGVRLLRLDLPSDLLASICFGSLGVCAETNLDVSIHLPIEVNDGGAEPVRNPATCMAQHLTLNDTSKGQFLGEDDGGSGEACGQTINVPSVVLRPEYFECADTTCSLQARVAFSGTRARADQTLRWTAHAEALGNLCGPQDKPNTVSDVEMMLTHDD